MCLKLCITLLVIQCSTVLLDAAEVDCSKVAKSNMMTLKKRLFCSYDPSVRPVKVHTNVTDVSMLLVLNFLIFDEFYNTLEIHGWVHWNWQDDHLVWDKSEYGGLEQLQVKSTEVWTPDVTTYDTRSMPDTWCTLKSQGGLFCVAPTVYTAKCTPNIRMWPFDSHNCSMRMGSWSYTRGQLNLTLEKKGILRNNNNNREWELVNANATRGARKISASNNTYAWITFRFEMRRHPGGQASSVVIPAVVLAVVTLVTFWLAPDSAHRLVLVCLNIFCHCLYMMYLAMMLPWNGDATPVIVTFFRDSFLLAAVSLLVTLCAARMCSAARAPPAWISSITTVILALPPGQLLLLGALDPKAVAAAQGAEGTEENAELYGPSSGVGGWRLFATLLDRLFFIVFFFTLFILLCAYIP